jgi:hypothetical protein
MSRILNTIPVILWSLITLGFLGVSISHIFYPEYILDQLEVDDDGRTVMSSADIRAYMVQMLGATALFGFSLTIGFSMYLLSKRVLGLVTTLALHLAFMAVLVLHLQGDNPWHRTVELMYQVGSGVGVGLTFLQVLVLLGYDLCCTVQTSVSGGSTTEECRTNTVPEVVVQTSQAGGALLMERAMRSLKH